MVRWPSLEVSVRPLIDTAVAPEQPFPWVAHEEVHEGLSLLLDGS